jgi:hypothetical protein
MLFHALSSYCALTVPIRMRIFPAGRWRMQLPSSICRALYTQCTLQSTRFNQDYSKVCSLLQQQPASPLSWQRQAYCSSSLGCSSSSSSSFFVLLRSLSCNEAISFEELASLVSHVCLEFNVQKDAEIGQACVEVCICNYCNVQVGGPPVGADDDEGFKVGDQALRNLCARGKITLCQVDCQQPNLLPLAFENGGNAAPATDAFRVDC